MIREGQRTVQTNRKQKSREAGTFDPVPAARDFLLYYLIMLTHIQMKVMRSLSSFLRSPPERSLTANHPNTSAKESPAATCSVISGIFEVSPIRMTPTSMPLWK